MSYTGSGHNPAGSTLAKEYANIIAYVWSDYLNELPQFQANPEQYLQSHGFPIHKLVPAGVQIKLAVDQPVVPGVGGAAPTLGPQVYWMTMPAPPPPSVIQQGLSGLQAIAEADWPYDTE